MNRPVVITGAGAICAAGDHLDTIFDVLCDGRTVSAPAAIPAVDAMPGRFVAAVPGFAPEKYLRPGNVRPLDRAGLLALVAVELALANSGWTPELRDAQPVGLVLGTMFSGVHTIGEFDRRAQRVGPEYASPLDFSNTVLNAAAGQVAIWHRLRGINSTISAGAASGVQALAYAAQLVRTGRADVLVAGGAEELSLETLLGFSHARLLAEPQADGTPGCGVPFDTRSTGAVLGEGAAFVVLESADRATARGGRVRGRILGSASTYDAASTGAPRGEGLARAIRRALHDAGTSAAAIGAVSAAASGSPVLDGCEAAAIAATVGTTTPVAAIKSVTGEALGASGPMQAIAIVEAMRQRRLPGVAGLTRVDGRIGIDATAETRPLDATRALVTGLTPDGNSAALVVAIE